jgi:hypothetical protein
MPVIYPRFDLANVADYRELYISDDSGSQVLNSATALLINYMPVIGVPELTANNAEDAWLRIAAHQAQLGTPIEGPTGEPLYLTREDVLRHAGLRTDGTREPIEAFWQYLCHRRPEAAQDSPFLRANGGHQLLVLFGVGSGNSRKSEA